MNKRFSVGIAAIVMVLFLSGCAAAQPGPGPSPTPSPDFDRDGAKGHCVETGGRVEVRQPTFGTNNGEESWVEIGPPVEVCAYQTLDDDDSRIYVDLGTIGADRPTLAALAYLAKPELPENAQGNPANQLCTETGGAINYGTTLDGGGLVDQSNPEDQGVSVCVFADGSFIDDWGIAYYGQGIVRGKDLTQVFQFDKEDLPGVSFDR